MPLAPRIDERTRGAILALRCEGHGWTAISEKVANCSPSAIKKFVERVIQRSQCDPTNLSLSQLLPFTDDPSPPGRQERFPEYGEVANEVVRLATLDEAHQELPRQAIIRMAEQNTGQRIPYTTGHGIFKKREIVKRAPPRKIRLDSEHKRARYLFAEWALSKLAIGIFIFTDETLVESCHHRKYSQVSVPKGANIYDYSRPPPRTFESVMFWGCICEGYRPGPFHVWEKETELEREMNDYVMEQENMEIAAEETAQRHRARQPGTQEHRILQEINTNTQ